MVVIKPRDLPLLRSAAMMAPRLDDGAGLRRLSEGTNGRVLAKPVARPHIFSNGFSNLILALRSLKIAVFWGHTAPSHGLVWRRQNGWPVGLNIWVRYAGLYARQPFLWAQELLDFKKIGFQ